MVSFKVDIRTTILFLVGFVIGTIPMSRMILNREANLVKSTAGPLKFRNNLYDDSLAVNLFEEVKILCLVMTNPANHRTQADHVKSTWGKRCNKLLFITTQEDDSLDTIVVLNITESRQALRRKTKTAFFYAHDNHLDEFDWFLKADDDRFEDS